MISLKFNENEIKNVKAVLFDKDGTFVDLHYFWGKITELRALEIIKRNSLDKSFLKQICLYLGYNIDTKTMIPDGITALYSRQKIIKILCENLKNLNIYNSEKDIEEIFDFVSEFFYKNITEYIKPIDSAIYFIKQLKECGLKLGIVTSDSITSTELTLKNFDWTNLFDVVIARENSSATKESGIPTQIAIDNLKIPADNIVMIGDTPTDYFSAKNAGIDNIILVATGQIDSNTLKNTTPCVVESLSEIEIVD